MALSLFVRNLFQITFYWNNLSMKYTNMGGEKKWTGRIEFTGNKM